MKGAFEFTLKGIRSEVDDEQIGFRLSGDKAKPVHFAQGFFRKILGAHLSSNLLGRFVYVVDAKGQIPNRCAIDDVMMDLGENDLLEQGIDKNDVQSAREVMQSLLNADSAVFGSQGSNVSYSAASAKFVTAKARYEEVGEIGAAIIQAACPELAQYVKTLLSDKSDELSVLFDPIHEDMSDNVNASELPHWTKKTPQAWKCYVESVRRSGTILLKNIKHQPKLLAIRTVIHFAIFHLIRYLAKQESFHDKKMLNKTTPILAVYSKNKRSALVSSSRNAFLQIGQTMARFYSTCYAKKFSDYDMDYKTLISIKKAPLYDDKKKLTKADINKAEQNDEVWNSAKRIAAEEQNEDKALLKLGQAVQDMVATASDVNPTKYIRGLALRTGIVYPATPNVKPYFRFTQDVTSMLVLASVCEPEGITGDDFLDRLRDNFDVITGANESDFDFCSNNIRGMMVDEDELNANGNAFVEQICDMGYGTVLSDGIFRVSTGV